MQILIHRGGQQYGPYSVDQAKGYMASGDLQADDLAWHEGAADWMPLSQVEGITPPAPISYAVPEPKHEPAWVPPRRTASSTPRAGNVPVHVPGTRTAVGTPRLAPAKPSPFVAQGSVVRSSRRSSSDGNDLSRRLRAIGARNMVVGGLLFVCGTVLTIFSYQMAAGSEGGGTYIVTWGSIVWGAAQFVKGVIQFSKA